MAEEKEAQIFTQKKKVNIAKQTEMMLQEHSSRVDDAKNSLARVCWERVGFYYESGNIKDAVSDLSLIINLSLDKTSWDQSNYLVKAYLLRGICRLSQGEYEKAIEDFTDSIGLSPSSQAYHYRHLAYAAVHRHAESQDDFGKITESKAIPLDDINKRDLVTAKKYSERADLEQRSEQFHKAALLYSEAIRLQPNIASYYHSRALAYERLGRGDQAEADRQAEAKFLESKKSPLPPYPPGVQQERLPTKLIEHIGTFEDSESLHMDFQTNKTHRHVLNKLITQRRLDLPEVEKQWNELGEIKEIKQIFQSESQKDPAVEDLPLLMKNYKYRVLILQHAIKKDAFALIRYLQYCGVDVNKSWIEWCPVSVTRSRGPRDMREEYEATEFSRMEYTATDLVVTQQPFPAQKILRLLNLGFTIDAISPRAYDLLKQGLPFTNKSDLVAAAKLIMFRFNEPFEDISDYKLSIFMSSKQYFPPEFIRKMEIVFLIRQLTPIIPSRLNPFAEKRDIPVLEDCIKRLNTLLLVKKMTSSTIQELENIKLELIFHSTPR